MPFLNNQSPLQVTLTANGLVELPIGVLILAILVVNTTGNAVTGGIKIGTTSGASDVASAVAIGANAIVVIEGSTLLKQWFSATAPQFLYIQDVSSWNSASLNFSVIIAQT